MTRGYREGTVFLNMRGACPEDAVFRCLALAGK